jgi:hypothetical protein
MPGKAAAAGNTGGASRELDGRALALILVAAFMGWPC